MPSALSAVVKAAVLTLVTGTDLALPLRLSFLTGMVRLSELRSTAQNSRPPKAATTLPDDIITQREEAKQAGELEEEDGEEEADPEAAEESWPRRRRPARPPEPEEKVRGKRQKDFDMSEQHESSDDESQKRERARATEEPWTQSQQKLLELALQQYPKGSSDRWDKIAKCVPSKSKVGDAGKEGLRAGLDHTDAGCSGSTGFPSSYASFYPPHLLPASYLPLDVSREPVNLHSTA